jgi:glutaredoxin-related protein
MHKFVILENVKPLKKKKRDTLFTVYIVKSQKIKKSLVCCSWQTQPQFYLHPSVFHRGSGQHKYSREM